MMDRKRSVQAHLRFLRRASILAREAATRGDEAFAALLVIDGKVLLEAMNSVRTGNNPTAHAEMNILRKARREISNTVLARAILYCSTEPCAMCAADILRTPITHVVYGRSGDPSAAGRALLSAAEPAIRVEGPLVGDRRQTTLRETPSKGRRPDRSCAKR